MTSKLDDSLQDSSKKEEQQVGTAKPEILKGWKIKLFVLLLCTISFFAGWQAYKARQANACIDLGGQMVAYQQVYICQNPNF